MLRHDRQIFRLEYDSFTEAPLRALLSFVKFAKPLVKRSKKQAADMGPNCCAITDYFHYVLPDFSDLQTPSKRPLTAQEPD
jgi:hypothetical protein